VKSIAGCADSCAFADFFKSSREAMYATSRDGRFTAVNAALAELLGYAPDELLGSEVGATYASPEDRARFQAAVEKSGVVHDYAVSLRRRDGAVLPCLVDAIAWRAGDGGAILGYHGIIRTNAAVVASFRRYIHRIRDASVFARSMGDDELARLMATGQDPLASRRRRVTILFFDIRGSTAIAERIDPEIFAALLSDVLTDTMDLIYGHRGSVNKLVGDGLLATFGCPLATEDDAGNAVRAALAVIDYLATFNDVRPDYLAEPLGAGIGLATGEVFAGVVGSVRRQEYTVLGDAVNVASRLQALTKPAGVPVLCDEATALAVRPAIDCAPVGRGRLRGRGQPVAVYAPRRPKPPKA
jgi:PAS domain S-box-containing protein